ncbi:MAG: phytanoyl-CoA dioxygenase family protein [Planctomycetes bacterium]|nr:phytanoyl-CoA dioxygenase family protein [Planctomycetota bacterium]
MLEAQTLKQIQEQGHATLSHVVPPHTTRELAGAFETLDGAGTRRGLLRPHVRALVCSGPVRNLAETVLGPHCLAIGATLFDKRRDANWLVSWHQDLTVALESKMNTPGYSSWSIKGGVPYAQPPREVLESLLAIRVDLDGSDATNGPLRVLPGTHRQGVLDHLDIQRCSRSITPRICPIEPGGALLMRPLLLHASSRATSPRRRRIIHVLFSSAVLAAPLAWHEPLGPDRDGQEP